MEKRHSTEMKRGTDDNGRGSLIITEKLNLLEEMGHLLEFNRGHLSEVKKRFLSEGKRFVKKAKKYLSEGKMVFQY